MSDQQRNKFNSKYAKLATMLFGLAVCSVSPSVQASETREQFALIGQPDVFFDGGSGPLTGVFNGVTYEIVQGYAVAQGDMVLGKVLANGKLDVPIQTRGLGQNSVFDRWPDGIIPYQVTDSVSQLQRDRALQAIDHWNSHTRIQMIPRTESNAANFNNYISFEISAGCASYVGMQGGEQTVWLADNCTVGSIIHEIGHAIGLFHEHTRIDRDDYVTVNLQNVSAGKRINFDKIVAGTSTYSDYDYGSIMHYGEYFFSRNGKPSISVPDNVSIGQRDALSDLDIASINKMYATDLKLAVSTETKDSETLVDLVVTNAGALGAIALTVSVNWGDSTQWQSFNADSGWHCQYVSPDVRCTRPSLQELSDSSLSILASPKGTDINTLKVRVESRTLDTDLTNNAFNDTINAQSIIAETETEIETEIETVDPLDSTPVTDVTQPNQDKDNLPINTTTYTTAGRDISATPPQTGAAQGDGGGGAAFYLFALLISVRLKRAPTQ